MTDLNWIDEYDASFMLDFLNTTFNHLHHKVNAKTFGIAAGKLNMEESVMTKSAEELGHILVDCATAEMSKEKVLEMKLPHIETFAEFYIDKYSELRDLASGISLHKPLNGVYLDFTWRLDVQMASRISSESIQPKYIIKLDREDGSNMLEASRPTLQHLYDELAAASRSITGPRGKKAERLIAK